MSHSHDHQLSGKRIFWVTLLNAVITLAEIIGGLVSGSLSLLSDAVHNLSDTLAIAFSYAAHQIAGKETTSSKTYGYGRSEILSAFVNALVLIMLSAFLAFEAIQRFAEPETINGTVMLVVAIIGLAANLVSMLLLEKDAHESLNIRSSYLHLLSDTLSSVGVIVGAILIRWYHVYWVDPLVTLLVAGYIFYESTKILKETTSIFMQSSPAIDFEELAKDVRSIEGVQDIHHIHVWRYDEKTVVFDAHVDFKDQPLSRIEQLYPKIEHVLATKYGLTHVTIQAETAVTDQKKLIFSNEDEKKDQIL